MVVAFIISLFFDTPQSGRVGKKKLHMLEETEGHKRPETIIMPKSSFKSNKCNTIPFNQTLEKKGCSSVVLENNYCMGKCNSFYIPTLLKTKHIRLALAL